MFKTIFVKEAP